MDDEQIVRRLSVRRAPELVIIAAVAAENRVIGIKQDLPWHIPADLKRFKAFTLGHAIIMGRRTYESLLHQFGGPLKGRRNIVVSSQPAASQLPPDVEFYSSVSEALVATENETTVFIGGGASLYNQFVDKSDRMELTLVDGAYEGDTYFPEYEHLVGNTYVVRESDERDGFRFVTYVAAN